MIRGRAYLDPHERCAHRRYWVTCAEYDDLIANQGSACKLCGRADVPLILDHDHAAGRWAVRGAVCQRCNIHMRQVDAGRREADAATLAYIEGAWHLAHAPRIKPVHEKRRRRLDAPSASMWDPTR